MNIKKLVNKFSLISGLVLFSLIIRLLTVYFFRDSHIDNEWKILLENLVNYKSYSYYTFDNQLIPSAYMPPMYAFFLYSVKFTTHLDGISFVNTIIFIQVLLSSYSVYLFYQISQNFFSNRISLINSIVFSIIPLNLYSCGQISSINLQVFFSLLFLKFLLLLINKKSGKGIYFFSIISGLLILTRGEFILILILIISLTFFYKKIKLIHLIKIVTILLIVTSPYLIRNYIQFNQIFIVKSLGFNLWKGNNEFSTAEGYEDLKRVEFKKLNEEINNLEKKNNYEPDRDKIFLNQAKINIRDNFFYYFKLSFKKAFSYYFFNVNSVYPNYYNLFHIMPILIISILSFPGIITFFRKNNMQKKCLGLYLFTNIFIFSVFFILPRYKLIILPIQIILAANFIIYIMNKYESK